MAQCITCGTELHPERAKKYNYCMARECQEKNAKGLTMVAVGMNKAADELMILDDRTREELASGKYRDQRRGSFGTSVQAPADPAAPRPAGPAPRGAVCPAPGRAPRRGGTAGPAVPRSLPGIRRHPPAARGPTSRKSARSSTTSRDSGRTRSRRSSA